MWGRATIEGHPVALTKAFASASLEFADATVDEVDRARESALKAVDALAGYTLKAVEESFEITFGATRVEGVIDLIACDPSGRVVVIDYKTGRTEDEHYLLQMALYRRVAELRYPDDRVEGAILRLAPDRATFAFGTPMSDDELDRAIAEVGLFESNIAKLGAWCAVCSYRGSPCTAPIGRAV